MDAATRPLALPYRFRAHVANSLNDGALIVTSKGSFVNLVFHTPKTLAKVSS